MNDNSEYWRNQAQQNLALATVISSSASSKEIVATEEAARAHFISTQAQTDALDAQEKASKAESDAQKAHAENKRYRALLARPLIEVLQENTDLKKAYEEQQKVLKDWIISQEAFRSLASRFRKELGISDEKAEELVQEAKEKAPEALKARGIL